MLNKIHYPGLNELRALAVLSIIPGHIEQVKGILKLESYYWFPVPGKLAVVLFFVISGFLITALLLKEKSTTKTISLKNFYIRRALRIWPLYFLIMALSILLFNKIEIFQMPVYSLAVYEKLDAFSFIMMLLVMPNYMGFIIPHAAQTWSIGIEEQFYLVQPFILKMIKWLWLVIVFMLLIVFLKEILYVDFIKNFEIVKIVRRWSDYFGCIAIGSIGAIVCHSYPIFIKNIVHSKFLQAMALLTFLAFLIVISVSHNEKAVDFRFHAIVFIVIIINAATNPSSCYNLNNTFLDYIGRISYGIYIYHGIGIILAIRISEYLLSSFEASSIIFNICVYCLTLFFTFSISVLSYKYFEGWFMSFKKNFKAEYKVEKTS